MKRRIAKKRRKTALRKINELLKTKLFVIDMCVGKDITVRSEYKAFFDSSTDEVKLSLIKSERL